MWLFVLHGVHVVLLPLETCTEHGQGLNMFQGSMSEGFIVALSGSVVGYGEKGVQVEALPISNYSSLLNLDCSIYVLIRCWSSIMLNRLSNLLISFFFRSISQLTAFLASLGC